MSKIGRESAYANCHLAVGGHNLLAFVIFAESNSMNVVDIPLNPRLAHAVWFCTRTSGSPLEGQHLQVLQVKKSLETAGIGKVQDLEMPSNLMLINISILASQEFLLDSTTVDATYLTIVGRARAEPVRLAQRRLR